MPTLNLPGQFAISTDPSRLPPEWPQRSLAGLHLATAPDLPVLPTQTPYGAGCGFVLGWPVAPGGMPESEIMLDGAEAMYRHGGKWALLYLTDREKTLYMDPAATLGAVFAPSEQVAGSTINLIPASPETRRNESLIAHLDVLASNRWYPFGLTPRHGCHRLLPNHRLDLETWTAGRHWTADGMEPNPDTDGAVELVAEGMKQTARGLASRFPLKGFLTAGRDTRMMLAVLREQVDRVRFYTLHAAHKGTDLDIYTARKIARRFRLDHAVIEWEQASEADIRAAFVRIGEARAGAGLTGLQMRRRMDASRIGLPGILGESARGYPWRQDDRDGDAISTAELIGRTKVPADHPDIQRAATEWRAGAPDTDRLRLLDLLYLENRTGCWAGPSSYMDGGLPSIFLLNRRDIVDVMLRLPTEYKRAARFSRDLIAREWPELLEIPFNTPPAALRLRRTMRRIVKRFAGA